MKLVVVKKGAKKWLSGPPDQEAPCCTMVEGYYWPCAKVALD